MGRLWKTNRRERDRDRDRGLGKTLVMTAQRWMRFPRATGSFLWIWWAGLNRVIQAAEKGAEGFAMYVQSLLTAALSLNIHPIIYC